MFVHSIPTRPDLLGVMANRIRSSTCCWHTRLGNVNEEELESLTFGERLRTAWRLRRLLDIYYCSA